MRPSGKSNMLGLLQSQSFLTDSSSGCPKQAPDLSSALTKFWHHLVGEFLRCAGASKSHCDRKTSKSPRVAMSRESSNGSVDVVVPNWVYVLAYRVDKRFHGLLG